MQISVGPVPSIFARWKQFSYTRGQTVARCIWLKYIGRVW